MNSVAQVLLLVAAVLAIMATPTVQAVKVVRQTIKRSTKCVGPNVVDWRMGTSGECVSNAAAGTSSRNTCGVYKTWSSSSSCAGPADRTIDYTKKCNKLPGKSGYTFQYSCVDLPDPVLVKLSVGTCGLPVDEVSFAVNNGVCTPVVAKSGATAMTLSVRADKIEDDIWDVKYWVNSTSCTGTQAADFPMLMFGECMSAENRPHWKVASVSEVKTPTKAPTSKPTKRPTKAPTVRKTKAPTSKPTKKATKAPTSKPTRQSNPV